MKISLQQHWTTTSLSQALHLGELGVLAAVAGALQLLDHPLQERHVRPHLGELPLVRRHLRRGRIVYITFEVNSATTTYFSSLRPSLGQDLISILRPWERPWSFLSWVLWPFLALPSLSLRTDKNNSSNNDMTTQLFVCQSWKRICQNWCQSLFTYVGQNIC